MVGDGETKYDVSEQIKRLVHVGDMALSVRELQRGLLIFAGYCGGWALQRLGMHRQWRKPGPGWQQPGVVVWGNTASGACHHRAA